MHIGSVAIEFLNVSNLALIRQSHLIKTEDVKKHCKVLETIWSWFEAVRKILDVTRHLKNEEPKKETSKEPSDIDSSNKAY